MTLRVRYPKVVDTFDSTITSDWENGGGDWLPFEWATGGVVQPPLSNQDCGMRRTTEIFGTNQYSKTVISSGGSGSTGNAYLAACVRMASGSNESAYMGWVVKGSSGPKYEICSVDSTFGWTEEATDGTRTTGNFTAGDYVVLEVYGVYEDTIELFTSESGGAETSRLTAYNSGIYTGNPGICAYYNNDGSIKIDSWEGGDDHAPEYSRSAVIDSSSDRINPPTSGLPASNAITIFGRSMLDTDSNTYSCLFLLQGTIQTDYQYVGTDSDGNQLKIFSTVNSSLYIATLSTGYWFDWAYTNNGTTQTLYYKKTNEETWTTVTTTGMSDITPTLLTFGNNDVLNQPFLGKHTHLRIWSIVLDSTDLLSEAYSGNAITKEGLWADYRFVSDSYLLDDSSGNSRHATSSGTITSNIGPLRSLRIPVWEPLNISQGQYIQYGYGEWRLLDGDWLGTNYGDAVQPYPNVGECTAVFATSMSRTDNNWAEIKCNYETYNWVGPVARMSYAEPSFNWTGYKVVYDEANGSYVWRENGDNSDQIGAYFTRAADGAVVRIEVETKGSIVECRVYHDGVLAAVRTDSSTNRVLYGRQGGITGYSDTQDTTTAEEFRFGELSASNLIRIYGPDGQRMNSLIRR